MTIQFQKYSGFNSMASPAAGDGDAGFVILRCIDSDITESEEVQIRDAEVEIFISTDDINTWNFASILNHSAVQIKADRKRLVGNSSYFRGLLGGNFSESCLSSFSIHWNVESFLNVLRSLFGCSVNVTPDNFVLLYEAALFFGVEKLLLKSQNWLREVTSFDRYPHPQLQLDSLVAIWKCGQEHANNLIAQLCTCYLARNFMWAISCNSFLHVPYEFLYSSIQHPQLTIDSEKHLCDAILIWLDVNFQHSGYFSSTEDSCCGLLKQIHTNLLPLWYLTGKRRCRFFSKFADESIDSILRLAGESFTGSMDIYGDEDVVHLRIRLTEFTKKLDLSGCPQIRQILLASLLPSSNIKDMMLRKNVNHRSLNLQHLNSEHRLISRDLLQALTFESVQEVDISNCPMLDFEDSIQCFSKSFPSLKKLKAVHYIGFDTKRLHHLIEKSPMLCEVDLTVDINPVMTSRVSIISSSVVRAPRRSTSLCNTAEMSLMAGAHLSNITRLTLEGRVDFSDFDLKNVAESCGSLCYLNINGCTSVTDDGISILILKCVMLHSILICDTSFGENSVRALCFGFLKLDGLAVPQSEKSSHLLASKLQMLEIGGCKGVSETSLSELISQTYMLKHLCLRETQVGNDSLYHFQGTSLERLDISETKVCGPSLVHVVSHNHGLKSLIARGCKHLLQDESSREGTEFSGSLYTSVQLYSQLCRSCKLDELVVGWGFSFFSLETLKPAVSSLKTLVVGLGGYLGQDGLQLLPAFCPLLEKLMIYFQVISDSIVINLVQSLRNLQVLAVSYCFGELSSLSFQFSMPNLRKLKLERVTQWMTNTDLIALTQSCANLVELSLLGCRLLNSESQDIISCGWPGLTYIHLEECGEVTSNGVSSLMNCRALEDLLLRHSGSGIPNNFIALAASKLPMLRKMSLDICDASNGDFDIPGFLDGGFLSIVKIARCKQKSCSLDKLNFHRTPVHKETLLLVWDSNKLTRTVMKERL